MAPSAAVNRRTFSRLLASLAATTFASRAASGRSRLNRIGLELYSVRDAMARDPDRTMAAVRGMGYTDVELLWSMGNFGRTPEQVKATLDREGLRAPSAHVSEAVVLVGWERSLDVAKMLGMEYIIVPSFSEDTSRSLDDWKEWADHFNKAGAIARKAGIWLAFHNEPNHMRPIGGQVPYDVFVERTDPSVVRHQFDIGNMVLGGGDPMAYLQRYRDRYWSFHVKDIVADRSRDTELGAGTVDLARLFAAIPDLDKKPCYVEQEGASDSLASAKKNWEYLKELEY
jgi:sugar phosphate isomerase/epimerase